MRRVLALLSALVLVALATPPAGAQSAAADPDPASVAQAFAASTWRTVIADQATGEVLVDIGGRELALTGSTMKLLTTNALYDAYGPDHRIVTPVRAQGSRQGSTLDGNLVLVGAGDQNLGGRGVLDGPIQFEPVDHTYATGLPGATLTPGDPLAGLDVLAGQVRAAGITRVTGDVVVDARLFEAWDPRGQYVVSPIVVNDNVVDVLATPTAPGEPAEVTWRPASSAYTVVSEVTTGEAGSESAISVSGTPDGNLLVTGSVAADAAPVLSVFFELDPPAFARSLFIDALERAGVQVDAPSGGPNPADGLAPLDQPQGEQVAALTAPPLSETATMVLKVSHNPGADLFACLNAVAAGSTNCPSVGLDQTVAAAERLGIPAVEVVPHDGAGDFPSSASPSALVTTTRHLTATYGSVFTDSLSIMGVDGELTDIGRGTYLDANLRAKGGTNISSREGGPLLVQTRALTGLAEAPSGRTLVLSIVTDNIVVDDFAEFFAAATAQAAVLSFLVLLL